jgi:excinuclease ABC subunit A
LSSVASLLEPIHRDSEGEVKDHLSRFRSERSCVACGGARLNDVARAVRIGGIAIHELTARTPGEVLEFLERFRENDVLSGSRIEAVAAPILKEVESRLRLLVEVGLSYLQLARPATTLSGGEAQRVRLAAQLGSHLTGVGYVLDEPTIGLHARDHRLLLRTLRKLVDATEAESWPRDRQLRFS